MKNKMRGAIFKRVQKTIMLIRAGKMAHKNKNSGRKKKKEKNSRVTHVNRDRRIKVGVEGRRIEDR